MAKDIGPTIGERIATLRGKRLTQTALAARADVSVDLIRKLEQGVRHTLSIRSLHQIARALDVDPAQLLAKTISLPEEGENCGVVAIREALTRVDHLMDDEPPVGALTLINARRGPDIAHLAVRDALRLAEFGSDPLRPAVLRTTLAWLLLTQGRSVEAHRLASPRRPRWRSLPVETRRCPRGRCTAHCC